MESCQNKITAENPTSKGWIDVVKKLKIETNTDKSLVLLSLLNQHEKVTVKITYSNDKSP